MVPPQFTPCGASWDPNRSAGCIGPFPSPPTVSFSEAAPKGIPRRRFRCLAPTGSSLSKREWRVLVFITAFNMCFLVYHFTLRKSITKTEKIYKNTKLLLLNIPGLTWALSARREQVYACEKILTSIDLFGRCAIMHKQRGDEYYADRFS